MLSFHFKCINLKRIIGSARFIGRPKLRKTCPRGITIFSNQNLQLRLIPDRLPDYVARADRKQEDIGQRTFWLQPLVVPSLFLEANSSLLFQSDSCWKDAVGKTVTVI